MPVLATAVPFTGIGLGWYQNVSCESFIGLNCIAMKYVTYLCVMDLCIE